MTKTNFTLIILYSSLLLFLFSCSVSMQSVKTLDLNSENTSNQRVKSFIPIDSVDIDSTLKYIGKISLNVKNQRQTTLDRAFEGLQLKAASYGANIYTVESPKCSLENSPCEVILNLFYANNFKKDETTISPNNTVFIFGSINSADTLAFKFDEQTITLNPFQYWHYSNDELYPHKIEASGGLFGSSIEFSTKENTPATYWMLASSKLYPTLTPTSIGVSSSKRSLTKVKEELGYFLTKVLYENNYVSKE